MTTPYESRRPRHGIKALTGLVLALGLVPLFGAGCGSQDGPIGRTSSALANASCDVAGDGTGPMSITYSPDGRATIITAAQKEKDGADTELFEFDLDKKKRLSIQVTNRGGTIDLVQTYDGAATVSGQQIKVSLHVTPSKDVTGSIDGHALVPFNSGAIDGSFVPKLADGTTLPAVLDDVQKELALAMNGLSKTDKGSCKYGGKTPAQPSLKPQGVPGHPGDPGPGCDDCHDTCAIVFGTCTAAGMITCVAFISIPIVGGGLVLICDIAAIAVCYGASLLCNSACNNIGSPCCPVACGHACCAPSETCLDTGLGLCCPAGTAACPGPRESCFDPRTERCQPDGTGCALTQTCGSACCGAGSHCFDPAANHCCADSQRCGSTCCGIGDACVTTPGVGQSCCPAERACGATCCGADQYCNTATNTCTATAVCTPPNWACLGVSTSICCTAAQRCANSATGVPLCLD